MEVEAAVSTLTNLAEVTTTFVGLAAIVASLRLTLGHALSPFQRLLVHFFVEAGMISVSIALAPVVLLSLGLDEISASKWTMFYAVAVSGLYLSHYVGRRRRIDAPTPLPSLLVMVGFAVWQPVLALVGLGAWSEPSLGLVTAYCYWALFSVVVIFISFLTSFVDLERTGGDPVRRVVSGSEAGIGDPV
jgi:hypothetical protein